VYAVTSSLTMTDRPSDSSDLPRDGDPDSAPEKTVDVRRASGRRPLSRSALIAVAVAVIVVSAGVGTYFALVSRTSSGASAVDDGPTFYQALEAANASIGPVSGGPWVLFQVYGVASPVPSYPSAWGWGEYDKTLASCEADFDGLTIWNGTIPLFDGTFNSGTAPFWQFDFFSNASQEILVATDDLGAVQAFPPIAMSSSCAVYSGMAYQPWASSWTFFRWAFPADSPAMANSAWDSIGQKFVAELSTTPSEMYYMGGVQFGSGQPFGTQVRFFTCGTPGAAGVTPGLDVFTNVSNTIDVTGWFNYTLGCTPTSNEFTAIPLDMTFVNATVSEVGATTTASQKLEFMDGSPPDLGPGFNTRGVTTSMIALSVTNGSGTPLPISGSGCSMWVASLVSCGANTSGWYAVLLSPNGAWQGSYGETVNGPAWNYPVSPVANNETIAVVVPSSWNVTGDTLEVTSATSELPLTGSIMFS